MLERQFVEGNWLPVVALWWLSLPFDTARVVCMVGSYDCAGITGVERIGGDSVVLSDDEIRSFIHESLASADLDGRSVCLVVPDGTRSCPLPLLLREVHAALYGRVTRMSALVALGTHAPMREREMAAHLGYETGNMAATYPGMHVMNHAWWDPRTFVTLGTIPAERVQQLSGGLLNESVPVRLNRAVVDHDVALVIGPVFPHEVVGFSGGNKYFFPGVSAQEMIDLSHWLGALITSESLIGTHGVTPVRALIDEAASLIPGKTLALCVVAKSGSDNLHAATFGVPQAAWASAADVSGHAHIRNLNAPVKRVLSIMPTKYEDLWTAAKGFYKVEPVVADGGEVIVYAPHVSQISKVHPQINEIGYHCRDYFDKQRDRFSHIPRGVLAHATHVRGAGTYDEERGECCRLTVTLATAIPESEVRAVNLSYLDPATVDLAAFEEDPETLVVPNAGEVLFRLR